MGRERNDDYQRISIEINSKCSPDGKWKLYIIVAEGDKTEYKYFHALKKQYAEEFRMSNLYVEFIDREESKAGNSHPDIVLETLDKFLEELKQRYQPQENYDELWLIVDTDEYDNRKTSIEQIYQKCLESSLYQLGLSNPCFELWLILHFVDLNTTLKDCVLGETSTESLHDYIWKHPIKKRPGICKSLLARIHQGKFPQYYETLIEYIPKAIPRAKILGGCSPNDANYPEQKIGTEVYKLLEKLTQLSINMDN
ncbi:RloB domain-containing protein [Sphaerospermopsis aphanizomenoides BCCUSP55]|uniref:RloB family protein n=1 Tax=Sphaerospermopsis aphanizomenoides TaxID=459663 RepID=UPI0019072E28|nr:RloB family protein [Sphaerospermopsis aphanizomenoides]MBK1988820.1 RloB domain-containing protein [Sphaerospermopsis aphanizomenoides BCCUSP55]